MLRVPLIIGARLLMTKPPPPLSVIVALLARVNPPATLATAPVMLIVELVIVKLLSEALPLAIRLAMVELPEIVPLHHCQSDCQWWSCPRSCRSSWN